MTGFCSGLSSHVSDRDLQSGSWLLLLRSLPPRGALTYKLKHYEQGFLQNSDFDQCRISFIDFLFVLSKAIYIHSRVFILFFKHHLFKKKKKKSTPQ